MTKEYPFFEDEEPKPAIEQTVDEQPKSFTRFIDGVALEMSIWNYLTNLHSTLFGQTFVITQQEGKQEAIHWLRRQIEQVLPELGYKVIDVEPDRG